MSRDFKLFCKNNIAVMPESIQTWKPSETTSQGMHMKHPNVRQHIIFQKDNTQMMVKQVRL